MIVTPVLFIDTSNIVIFTVFGSLVVLLIFSQIMDHIKSLDHVVRYINTFTYPLLIIFVYYVIIQLIKAVEIS